LTKWSQKRDYLYTTIEGCFERKKKGLNRSGSNQIRTQKKLFNTASTPPISRSLGERFVTVKAVNREMKEETKCS
jgi:hypothetical protein